MERALEVFLATLNSLYRRETEARGSKDQAKAAELIPRTSAPAQCVVGGVWKALQKYLRLPAPPFPHLKVWPSANVLRNV